MKKPVAKKNPLLDSSDDDDDAENQHQSAFKTDLNDKDEEDDNILQK